MGKIRFRANKKGGFKLPPEGTFDLQIVGVSEGTDREGAPQVIVKFEIADGPHSGSAFRQYYTLNEERSWLFKKLCEVAGLEVLDQSEDEDDEEGEFDVDIDELNERYIRATIELNKKGDKTFVNLRDEQPSKLQAQTDDDGEGDADGEDDAQEEEGDAEAAPAGQEAAPPRRRRPPPA